MILLLAPSKTQDFESPNSLKTYTQSRLAEKTLRIVDQLKQYSVAKLAKLMSISDKLANVNFGRYQNFEDRFILQNARQALLAFKGDVYTDVEVESYTDADFEFAQQHLRILSGLYGALRPLDLIQPYRLEMKTPLKIGSSKNLYEFWGDQITDLLNYDLKAQGDDILVNLTSEEYFKSIQPKKLQAKVITIVFMEKKKDQEPKIVPIFSKRARGTMANFIIRHKLTKPEQLKEFDQAKYCFETELSDDKKLVFIRNSQ